jgi:hypothetical protein
LTLEDGGEGDEDGVKNGVIVDPFAVGYVDPLVTNSASLSTGDSDSGAAVNASSCFISAANRKAHRPDGFFGNDNRMVGDDPTGRGYGLRRLFSNQQQEIAPPTPGRSRRPGPTHRVRRAGP